MSRHFIFSFTFRIILIVAACAIALSYLSIFIDPSIFALPMFFGLFFIPIAIINLLLLITALLNRSRSGWIPLIALLPFLLFAESFVKVGSGTKENPTYQHSIKIESYNVGMFASSKDGAEWQDCRKRVIEHIKEQRPDIVCLQEFFASSQTQTEAFLLKEYPYRYYKLFNTSNNYYLFGNIILSRHPIIENGSITFNSSTNLSIFADIKIGGDTIRIYNNHLESYNLSFTSIIKKWTGSQNLIEMHDQMKGSSIRRSDQVNTILKDIESSRHKVIICGDFNDTPVSYTYHKLAQNRKDSFKEAGRGFAATFAPLWPLLRIDYILFPKEFEGISHNTLKETNSDHYPVVAEIGYNNI